MSRPEIERQIARCEQEIEEIRVRPGPDRAYLTVMGVNDWEHEKRLLQRMAECSTITPLCDTPGSDETAHRISAGN